MVYYRKLIKFGASSFVISLPAEWIKKNKLEKGSTLFLEENSSSEILLSLNESSKKEDYEVVIDTTNKDKHQLNREINSAYVRGATTLILKGKGLRNNSATLKKILHNLMGLEIMEQDYSKIVAKDLLAIDNISIENIIRKISLITQSMMEDLKKFPHDISSSKNLYSRDEEVNRLTFLILRIVKSCFKSPALAKRVGMNNEELFKTWKTVDVIEEIADEAKRISRLMVDTDTGELRAAKFFEVYDEIYDLYIDALKSYYKNDKNLALNVSSRKATLVKKCDELITSHNTPQMARIIERMKAMVTHIRYISRVVYQ